MKRRSLLFASLTGMLALTGCSKPQAPPTTSAPAFDNSSERELSYLLEREDQGKATPVSEDFNFRSGDRFRIRLSPDFPAYVYVANRGAGQSTYQILFPRASDNVRNPLSKGTSVALPGDTEWFRFDESPGNEYFVLIASTVPLPDIEKAGAQIPRDTFESQLAAIERSYRPDSSRRFQDHNWTKFFAARNGALAIVVRLALQHQ